MKARTILFKIGLQILDLNISHSSNFSSFIGNGDRLKYTSYRPNISLCLGKHAFTIDLYVLPISEADAFAYSA